MIVLREALQSDQFRVVGAFPIETNQSWWEAPRLLLYENRDYGPPTDKELHIPMLSLGRDIVVPFDQLGLQ